MQNWKARVKERGSEMRPEGTGDQKLETHDHEQEGMENILPWSHGVARPITDILLLVILC